MQDSKNDTDVKNRLLDYVGEGKGGMIWGNSTETCILPYVKEMTNASSMYEAGHSKSVLWDNQRDGVGRELGGWDRCTLIADSCWCMAKPLQYCKVIASN